MSRVIVQRIFDPPLTPEEHLARSERLGPCLMPERVTWIRSFVSNDRSFGVCEFDAPDAEAVRVAHRTARVPFERVWTASVYEPGGM